MVITLCFFEMENYVGILTTGYSLSNYRAQCLTTGHRYQVTKGSLSLLIYAGIKSTYDSKVAYIVVYLPTKFENIRLKIKEITGHTLTCVRLLGTPLYLSQW